MKRNELSHAHTINEMWERLRTQRNMIASSPAVKIRIMIDNHPDQEIFTENQNELRRFVLRSIEAKMNKLVDDLTAMGVEIEQRSIASCEGVVSEVDMKWPDEGGE